jgi:hypothetical protein
LYPTFDAASGIALLAFSPLPRTARQTSSCSRSDSASAAGKRLIRSAKAGNIVDVLQKLRDLDGEVALCAYQRAACYLR